MILIILVYVLGFIIGSFLGFVGAFGPLYLLDLFPEIKLRMLGGDRSGYLGLAIIVSFWMWLMGGIVGVLVVHYMRTKGIISR